MTNSAGEWRYNWALDGGEWYAPHSIGFTHKEPPVASEQELGFDYHNNYPSFQMSM
jgi:hypothetical protein